MPSILVVGSINLDLTLQVHKLPRTGENLIGQAYCRAPGGKGANQAVAAARLGAEVTFVGKLGNDSDAAFLAKNLATEGVRTDFLLRDETAQTGLAVITVGENGENTIVVFPGANREIDARALQSVFRQKSHDAVLLQLETSKDVVIETCRLAQHAGIPVILDAGPAQAFPLEKLGRVSILTPNETEATALTGILITSLPDADRAASSLLRRSNAAAVILKLGDQGAYLKCADGASEHFPAYPVRAVDTTAAGDAFTAALAVNYLEIHDLHAAIRIANKAGAFAATKLGAQASLPTAQELAEFCPENLARENAI